MPRNAISCELLESVRDNSASLRWRFTQLVGQAGANIECLEVTTGQVRSGLCMRSMENELNEPCLKPFYTSVHPRHQRFCPSRAHDQ